MAATSGSGSIALSVTCTSLPSLARPRISRLRCGLEATTDRGAGDGPHGLRPEGQTIFAWTLSCHGNVKATYRIGSRSRGYGTGYHDHNWMNKGSRTWSTTGTGGAGRSAPTRSSRPTSGRQALRLHNLSPLYARRDGK